MSLEALEIPDTRPFFRPLTQELVAILETLPPESWALGTIAGRWRVRDVVAHLIDVSARRLSFHRDGHTPPQPAHPITSQTEFTSFINELNREWVEAARRLSPRVLTSLLADVSRQLADFAEAFSLDGQALFPVSWAGEDSSAAWFDLGREFTELWHHQMQIREAAGAQPPSESRWLRAVLLIAVRGLPHAYRSMAAAAGVTVTIHVTGDAGGLWTLQREPETWKIHAGKPAASAARITLSDDTAWRLLFNALPESKARLLIQCAGEQELAMPLLRARSVIV